MRKAFFMANWKMHKSPHEAKAFAESFKRPQGNCDIVVCPAFPSLYASLSKDYALGAQNIYPAEEGAFTGEVSPGMLRDAEVKYVLVGHSERRSLFGENNDFIREKFQALVDAGLTPVLCIGEDLATRQEGKAEEFCCQQLDAVLKGSPLPSDLIIAYEPVWAIGSGQSAKANEVQDMLHMFREYLSQLIGSKKAVTARLLYGGSVNRDNISKYLAQADIDGALIGGASLDAEHFADLIARGCEAHE